MAEHSADPDSGAAVQARWDNLHLDRLLALDACGAARFRSRCSEDNRNGRVFGGQLLGQALRAAQVGLGPDRSPASMQVIFMQGALVDRPIDYRVMPLQDGKRFSSKRVVATQGDRSIIDAHISFAVPIASQAHAAAPQPACPPPGAVLPMDRLASEGGPVFEGVDWPLFEKPCLELRIIAPGSHLTGRSPAPGMAFWVRLRAPLGEGADIHAAALAYLSDYWINSAAITHHIPARDAHAASYIASLNHAIWFHQPARADGWLLFELQSPAMQGGRALSHARIFSEDGVLLASATQECLFVPR